MEMTLGEAKGMNTAVRHSSRVKRGTFPLGTLRANHRKIIPITTPNVPTMARPLRVRLNSQSPNMPPMG